MSLIYIRPWGKIIERKLLQTQRVRIVARDTGRKKDPENNSPRDACHGVTLQRLKFKRRNQFHGHVKVAVPATPTDMQPIFVQELEEAIAVIVVVPAVSHLATPF